MVTKRDYSEDLVEATRSVLLELVHLLGEYWDHIVLIGGWVPELLMGSKEFPHIGSIDVDLALNHLMLKDEGYKSIEKLLVDRGYLPGKSPSMFERKVAIGGSEITVQVDLLSGEYQGTGKSHRHQKIQVASIVPFLVMKGMALNDRLKEKDAWDIYYCIQNYPGGLEVVVSEFRPHLNHGLVQEGLKKPLSIFNRKNMWGQNSWLTLKN
jgi:hypothetical protein